jgi:hypothetical protein
MFLPSAMRTVIIFIWIFPHPASLSFSAVQLLRNRHSLMNNFTHSCVYLFSHHCCNLLIIFLRQAVSYSRTGIRDITASFTFVYICTVLSIQMVCLFRSTIHQNACREYSLSHLLSVYIGAVLPLQMILFIPYS